MTSNLLYLLKFEGTLLSWECIRYPGCEEERSKPKCRAVSVTMPKNYESKTLPRAGACTGTCCQVPKAQRNHAGMGRCTPWRVCLRRLRGQPIATHFSYTTNHASTFLYWTLLLGPRCTPWAFCTLNKQSSHSLPPAELSSSF